MTLHFAQLSGTQIRIQSRYKWVIQRLLGCVNQLMWSGCSHGTSNPTIYNLYLSCTPSLPALSYLCFVAFGSSTRRYKSQVHAFSLFALFRTRVHLAANSSLSVTKVRYTFFLLSPFMHASSSSFDFVLRAKTIGENPPLKGQENAAH